VAFIVLQLLALVIVALSPSLVNYLPTRMSLTSETAPPPLNPRWQACTESHVFAVYDERGGEIRAAITKARGLDVSYLPAKLQESLTASFDKAEATFGLVENVRTAQGQVAANRDAYAPLHAEVRTIQRDVKKHELEIRELETTMRRVQGDDDRAAQRRSALEAEIKALKDEQAHLTATIPTTWDEKHKAFAALLGAEKKALAAYRRNVDSAYEPVGQISAMIKGAEVLAALEGDLKGLKAVIANESREVAAERIAELAKRIAKIEGARTIRRMLLDARRAVRAKTPDLDKAAAKLDEAVALHGAELAWRQRAARELAEGIAEYDGAIRTTIGLRLLQRLPKEEALSVASCMSDHRNISLHF